MLTGPADEPLVLSPDSADFFARACNAVNTAQHEILKIMTEAAPTVMSVREFDALYLIYNALHHIGQQFGPVMEPVIKSVSAEHLQANNELKREYEEELKENFQTAIKPRSEQKLQALRAEAEKYLGKN